MNEGWVKIHRKVFDNPIVCKDAEVFAIWMYLLLNATHTEYDVLFKGKRITLQKGQLVTGIISIAKKLKVDKNKVQRTLKMFENEKQIEQQTSNKNRLISIVSWEEYQENDKQNDKQVINNRETTDKQVITNKNIKNINNINNNNIYGHPTKSNDHTHEKQFEKFYSFYPRKVKRQDVMKWFEKNKPSCELFSSMMHSLEQFRASKEWLEDGGKYIPYPSTWLNQRRWEDETIELKNEIETQEDKTARKIRELQEAMKNE